MNFRENWAEVPDNQIYGNAFKEQWEQLEKNVNSKFNALNILLAEKEKELSAVK